MQKQHYWHEAKKVSGPFGGTISAGDLPAVDLQRWTPARKAIVVTAVAGGLLSFDAACQRYSLSADEFLAWQRDYAKDGINGLKVSRIQANR